jgi:hypothetical protein
MGDKRQINIRPRSGMYSVFSAVTYKAWFALGEYVDNSIQSFLNSRREIEAITGESPKLIVDIETSDDDVIVVRDNAGGIGSERLDAAFQPGEKPPDSSGLSVYGIGMKSAGAWFGDRMTVTSSAIGESVVRTLDFDFPTIAASDIEILDVEEDDAAAEEHYTEIRLELLNNPIQTRTHQKVREHLASIYRMYLRSGDISIRYNGEPLVYRSPKILTYPFCPDYENDPSAQPIEWRRPIDFELGDGVRIHGFAALRETGSTASAGFALLRAGRVITGLEDAPWKPVAIFGRGNSFASQRLFGELNLENIQVAYSKDGFVWVTPEEDVIDAVKQVLVESPSLLVQADKYRAKVANKSTRSNAKKALKAAAKATQSALTANKQGSSDSSSAAGKKTVAADGSDGSTNEALLEEQVLLLPVEGEDWKVNLKLIEDPDDVDLLKHSNLKEAAKPREIDIQINLAAPFMRAFGGTDSKDLQTVIRFAIAVSLASVQATFAGTRNVHLVLRSLNTILATGLGKP